MTPVTEHQPVSVAQHVPRLPLCGWHVGGTCSTAGGPPRSVAHCCEASLCSTLDGRRKPHGAPHARNPVSAQCAQGTDGTPNVVCPRACGVPAMRWECTASRCGGSTHMCVVVRIARIAATCEWVGGGTSSTSGVCYGTLSICLCRAPGGTPHPRAAQRSIPRPGAWSRPPPAGECVASLRYNPGLPLMRSALLRQLCHKLHSLCRDHRHAFGDGPGGRNPTARAVRRFPVGVDA